MDEDFNGAVQVEQQMAYARGPRFWKVHADGAWSQMPKP